MNKIQLSESYTVPMPYIGMLILQADYKDSNHTTVNDWRSASPDALDFEGVNDSGWNTPSPFTLIFNYDDYTTTMFDKTVEETKNMLVMIGPMLVDGGRSVAIEVNEDLEAYVEYRDHTVCLYNPAHKDLILDLRDGGADVIDYNVVPEALFEEAKALMIGWGVKFE